MITEIKTITDVETFAHQLVSEGLRMGFHPDTPFEDYITMDDDRKRLYTAEEAAVRNRIIDQCFDVCDQNDRSIYEVTGRITLKDTPAETMFDEDHEEKYTEYMRQVEAGERVYGFPKKATTALL